MGKQRTALALGLLMARCLETEIVRARQASKKFMATLHFQLGMFLDNHRIKPFRLAAKSGAWILQVPLKRFNMGKGRGCQAEFLAGPAATAGKRTRIPERRWRRGASRGH